MDLEAFLDRYGQEPGKDDLTILAPKQDDPTEQVLLRRIMRFHIEITRSNTLGRITDLSMTSRLGRAMGLGKFRLPTCHARICIPCVTFYHNFTLPQSSPVCLSDTARVGIRVGAPLPKPWGALPANSDPPVATSARRRMSYCDGVRPLHTCRDICSGSTRAL